MRIDGGIAQGQLNISNISDILGKLNVGDVVRAQVIDMVSNELILKLFDGTTMNASSLAQLDVKLGDFVNFTVKAKNENQLFLETIKDTNGSEVDSSFQKQLLSLDIKPGELSLSVAKELKNQNIPINRDIIEKAVEGVLKFKNLTPDKAVFLAANNLQVNENQIAKLNNLIESKVKVSSDIKDLVSLMDTVDDPEILINLEKSMRGLFHEVKASDMIQQKESSAASIKLQENMTAEKATIEKALQDIQQAAKTALGKEAGSIKQAEDAARLHQSLEILIKASIGQKEDISAQKLLAKMNNELKPEGIHIDKLPVPMQKALNSILNDTALKLKQLESVDTSLTVLQHKQANIAKEAITKELESSFVKIDEKLSGKDIDAKKLYNDLSLRLEALREGLQNSVNNNTVREMLSRIDNLESNIRFFNDINSYSSYVQIPLNINNNHTTGDLYILRRDSKKKKIDPENATMYISLNTEHMGQVDSLININKKNVSVNMRVEEQRIIDFLKENHKDLYNRLQEKGYKLVDFKYRLLDIQTNVLNVNTVIQKEMEGSRLSFDYRV